MTTNPNMNPPASGQTPPSGDPPGQTPPLASGQTPPTQLPAQKTPLEQLPEDVRDYIRTLRKEAKDLREASEARERERQEAEEARKLEQGQYKDLAEQRATRIKELEPKAARFDELAEKIRKQIQKATKEWPAEVKTFYPGDDADVSVLQDWYDRSQPLLERLQQQARGQAPGNAPNPQASQPTPDDARKTYEQRLRSSGKYGA